MVALRVKASLAAVKEALRCSSRLALDPKMRSKRPHVSPLKLRFCSETLRADLRSSIFEDVDKAASKTSGQVRL